MEDTEDIMPIRTMMGSVIIAQETAADSAVITGRTDTLVTAADITAATAAVTAADKTDFDTGDDHAK